MSKCSKKCNEIKQKIDNISGLDDEYVYDWLKRLDNVTEAITGFIKDYADRNELNGTCFKECFKENEETNINKADKLFEELGYKKRENKDFIYYTKKTKRGTVNITFWKTYKFFTRALDDSYCTYIDMEELKAINLKCKELGWVKE